MLRQYPITKKHEPMADDAHEKLEKALQKLEDMLEVRRKEDF